MLGKAERHRLAALPTSGENFAGLAGTLRGQSAEIADRDLLLPKSGEVLLAFVTVLVRRTARILEKAQHLPSLRRFELLALGGRGGATSIDEAQRLRGTTVVDAGEHRVSPHLSKPILRVPEVSFAAVHDRVPVVARLVTLVPLGEQVTPMEIVVQ